MNDAIELAEVEVRKDARVTPDAYRARARELWAFLQRALNREIAVRPLQPVSAPTQYVDEVLDEDGTPVVRLCLSQACVSWSGSV